MGIFAPSIQFATRGLRRSMMVGRNSRDGGVHRQRLRTVRQVPWLAITSPMD